MNRMRSRAKATSSIRAGSNHVTINGHVVNVVTPSVVVTPTVSTNSNEIVLFNKAIGRRPVGATN